MTALALALCALAGCTAGLAAAVVWLMLNLPSRVMDICGVICPKLCGWALTVGMTLGTLASLAELSLPLGQAAGVALMLAGGVMTGMLAASLAEAADVLPKLMERMRLTPAAPALCWAMAAGKALGAFAATYWTLW